MQSVLYRAPAILLLIAATQSIVLGQFGRPPAGTDQTQFSRIFHPAPRVLRQYLSRAQEAIEEERYSDAVEHLYAVLTVAEAGDDTDEGLTQDYLLPAAGSKTTNSSVRTEAQRLLGSMPARGRELYELRCGAEAQARLDAAVAAGDVSLLAEVTRKYFHTKAGYQATFLLGQYHLNQGRPLAGALALRRVHESPVAKDYDPDLSLTLATCWLHAKHVDKAKATILALKKRDPRIRISLDSQKVDIFQSDANALAWIQQTLGKVPSLKTFDASQWTMFGGAPNRNATAKGTAPLMRPRWHVPTSNLWSSFLKTHGRSYQKGGTPLIPATNPLVVDGVALMRTPERLIAVDMQTGKRFWWFPWQVGSDSGYGELADTTTNAAAITKKKPGMINRVWADHPYGQLSSDGTTVYALEELNTPSKSNAAAMRQRIVFGGNFRPTQTAQDHNVLVALSLPDEGKLKWSVGGENSEVEELVNAFFLGAPLPLLGQVYCLAEVNGEVQLVVLDAATGRLAWKQQLAHVEQARVQVNMERRLAGATPSFADGVLVCPTSAGAITAVDLATRTLLWGYMYDQPRVNQYSRFGGFNRYGPAPNKAIDQRWADSNVKISEGVVVVTPIESDELHCIDLLTGKPRWSPIKRNNMVFVAGIHDGKIIVVERQGLSAIKIADGKKAWSVTLPSAVPSGRGFISNGRYFLPTTNSKLVTIDLSGGKIVREVVTDRVLGNLVCYEDQIISQSESELAAFYQLDPLRQRVDRKLDENPTDEWALRWKSELLLHDGKRQEALGQLRLAMKEHGESIAVQALLVKTLFAALEDDFQANSHVAAEVEDLITPDQRWRYWQLMAVGLEQTGDYAGSAMMTLKILGVDVDDLEAASLPTGPSVAWETRELDDDWHGRLARWASAHLRDVMDKLDGQQEKRINAVVQHLFDRAVAENSTVLWRRFTDVFGQSSFGEQAKLSLSELVTEEFPLEAELLLTSLVDSANDEVALAASQQLAQLYVSAGKTSAATHRVQALQRRWPDADLGDLASLATAARAAWPQGNVTVTKPKTSIGIAGPLYEIPVVDWRQAPDPLATVRVERNNSLVLVDQYGNDAHEIRGLNSANNEANKVYQFAQASGNGSLLLLGQANEIVAFNLLSSDSSNAVLWRLKKTASVNKQQQVTARPVRRIWGERRWKQVGGGVGFVTLNGAVVVKERQLICANPLTGEPIWWRDNIPVGCSVFGDERYAVVVSAEAGNADVYNIADGALVASQAVGPIESHVKVLGTNLLTWDKSNHVKLVNIVTGKTLWERKLQPGAKGTMVGVDEFAMMERRGDFRVISVRTGDELVTTTLEKEPGLQTLHVFASPDQYSVVVNRQYEGNAPSNDVSFEPISVRGLAMEFVTGKVYVWDKNRQRLRWAVPAYVERYGLLLDQPSSFPMLIFARHVARGGSPSGNSSPAKRATALLGIDKRTGQAVLSMNEQQLPFQTTSMKLFATPDEQSVTVVISNQPVVAAYVGGDVPPEPPFRAAKTPVGIPDVTEQLKGMIQIFGPAFQRK